VTKSCRGNQAGANLAVESGRAIEDDLSAQLLARWHAGDRQAADARFGRDTARSIALARRRLSTKRARRLDPEDVVQSAYRSFCAADADRFVLQRSGNSSRLLVGITLYKLQHQIQRPKVLKSAGRGDPSAAL
jgi:hypothetical protein